jgi:predicted anti-sigma-YlaC factor YlaD
MTPSTCNHLDDYLAGDLDGRQRTEFESHLEACAACREEQRAQAELARLLRAATETLEAFPAELPAGINRRIAASASRKRRRVAAAATLAAVAACAVTWALRNARDERAIARPQPGQRQTRDDAHEISRQQGESGNVDVADAAVASPAAEVRFAASPEMIAVPVPSENPNVTIFWLYPAVRTAGR